MALSKAGDDSDDELKGCGLRALWPDKLNVKELFSLITWPRHSDLLGAYRYFCNYELLPHLQPADLHVALEWVRDQPPRGSYWAKELVDGILSMAWDNLDAPHVLDTLAHAIVVLSNDHDDMRVPADREPDRQRVVKSAICVTSDAGVDPISFCSCSKPLVMNADVDWLLKELNSAASEGVQRFIATLVRYVADLYNQPDQLDAVLSACEKKPNPCRNIRSNT